MRKRNEKTYIKAKLIMQVNKRQSFKNQTLVNQIPREQKTHTS